MNTCLSCLDGLEIPTRGRPDLLPQGEEDDDYDTLVLDPEDE